ncbi:phosphonate ABC transporter, permease protein PhnE [Pseudovibrio sp. Tun.PSC04-5.I4]|uniref:phosphonate ABC transporter, permease protein PhnE n=1 Tax=Pseudovibrio sp. Tun.PSC04-5.I4 TaxID=1798213 RepID=UPI00088E3110|nr:phosphonate ABC transporter, permease protein PhnE [Pseudovibrio sp. Tun.PSC04-5.I4]SDR13721.1 phosphonate transport system permease protein [Pseudovibrio sp. Tun.PSC04-5.I4]
MAAHLALTEASRLAEISQAYEQVARRRTLYTFFLLGVCALSIFGGLYIADEANSGGFWTGLDKFFDYPAELFAGAYETGLAGLFGLVFHYSPYLFETINIAMVSTLIAFFLGGALSFVASRNLVSNRFVVGLMRRVMDIFRAFPEIVIALLLVLILGPSPVAAIIAVTTHTIGALAKQFSEVNENCDLKAAEGIGSVGGNWLEQIRYGILPQVMPNFLSYTLLRLEVNVRASAILGFVGAGGLGAELKMVVDWNYGADILVIIFMLVFSISSIDYLSGWLRQKLIGQAVQV